MSLRYISHQAVIKVAESLKTCHELHKHTYTDLCIPAGVCHVVLYAFNIEHVKDLYTLS